MLEEYKHQNYTEKAALDISAQLARIFKRRRTIRSFSKEKPPKEVIDNALKVASLAPSGANKQPWFFAVVENQELKDKIRMFSEANERKFYLSGQHQNWVDDLKHLHTDPDKEFLSKAPYLIAVLFKNFAPNERGENERNYYAKESTGLATGFLISALHMSGLSTLTYTPTRMQFLPQVLERPQNERCFMLLAVGLPEKGCQVPVVTKKSLEQVRGIYS